MTESRYNFSFISDTEYFDENKILYTHEITNEIIKLVHIYLTLDESVKIMSEIDCKLYPSINREIDTLMTKEKLNVKFVELYIERYPVKHPRHITVLNAIKTSQSIAVVKFLFNRNRDYGKVYVANEMCAFPNPSDYTEIFCEGWNIITSNIDKWFFHIKNNLLITLASKNSVRILQYIMMNSDKNIQDIFFPSNAPNIILNISIDRFDVVDILYKYSFKKHVLIVPPIKDFSVAASEYLFDCMSKEKFEFDNKVLDELLAFSVLYKHSHLIDKLIDLYIQFKYKIDTGYIYTFLMTFGLSGTMIEEIQEIEAKLETKRRIVEEDNKENN